MSDDAAISSMIHGLIKAGMKPADIAAESGLSKAQVWRYENGRTARPSHDSFERIDRLSQRVGVSLQGGRRR